MSTDKIADLLTRIRNGQSANHKDVRVQKSKTNTRILNVLKTEGFIDDFNDQEERVITVKLRYIDGIGAIKNLTRISKPGRRVYSGIGDVKPVFNGLGLNVLSTSHGIMSDYEAVKQNVGGELLFKVF